MLQESKNSNYISERDQLTLAKESLLNPAEVKFNFQEDQKSGLKLRKSTSVDSDIETASTASTNKRKIPDGGYGWIIVFASLMVSLIADGISFSFGLLYTEFLNYFQESPTKTAWIGSLFLAVPLISGPVMSNLVDKYGCQKMTMIGGILGCAGFVISAVSDSVEMLFLTFGIIAGLGLGIIYVTAVVSIAFWFETKRTFAIGIGASGTGIGTFLYAPFTQWLISYYGWRGATLILGGTLLNFCVFGALMIDPDWLIEENKLESRSQSIQTFSNSSICLDELKKMIETGAPKEDLLDTLVTNLNTEANQQVQDPEIVNSKKFQSEILLPTFISGHGGGIRGFESVKYSSGRYLYPHHEEFEAMSYESGDFGDLKIPEASTNPEIIVTEPENLQNLPRINQKMSISQEISNKSIYLPSIPQLQPLEDSNQTIERSGVHGSRFSLNEKVFMKPTSTQKLIELSKRRNTLDVTHNHENFPLRHQSTASYQQTSIKQKSAIKAKSSSRKHAPLIPGGNLKNLQSLRYNNYLKNMRVHRNSIHYRGAMLNTHRYRLKASSCPNIYRNSMTTIAKEDEDVWYDDCVDIMKSIFDFSLFWQYKFGMMSLSTLFLYAWYIIPYFYITEFLLAHGYTEEASAYLISVIGIFSTVGMIVLGWVGDQSWCNVTKTYGFCMFFCGASMFLIPLATWSYSFLMLLCAVFGVTFGSSFSFTPMITSRLVDMDDFTLAYGLILLVQGIGSLVGPPLAGWIFDMTNRWDDSFYIGGVFVILSGFFCYIIGALYVESTSSDDDDERKNKN